MTLKNKNTTPPSLRATRGSAAIQGLLNTILSWIASLLSRLTMTIKQMKNKILTNKLNNSWVLLTKSMNYIMFQRHLKQKYKNKMKDLGIFPIKTIDYTMKKHTENSIFWTRWMMMV